MFILITPAHNEIDQVDGLVKCIESSSLKPDIWLIVDDCSDDGTGDKFKQNGKDLDFMRIHRIKESSDYMEFHYSHVLIEGIASIRSEISQADFVGILDADIRFGKHYWEKLKNFLTINPDYGIVSGVLCSPNKNGTFVVENFQRTDNPRGGLRLMRGSCFREIGKVQRSRAPDSIMNVKCRILKWKICIINDVYAVSTRSTNDRINIKAGAISFGVRAWHLHQPFWQVFIRTCALILKGHFKRGFYYIIGFYKACWHREEQFPDKEIRHYYRYTRTLEWINMSLRKICNKPSNITLIPIMEKTSEEIFI
ncbi:MAG: glycosyltransferase family 2 protein [Candidatus Cloacimonetes bacterium]|nr:glycosyltransferase family 2 protein [Candidatus Cloacimonadota bacterium]